MTAVELVQVSGEGGARDGNDRGPSREHGISHPTLPGCSLICPLCGGAESTTVGFDGPRSVARRCTCGHTFTVDPGPVDDPADMRVRVAS